MSNWFADDKKVKVRVLQYCEACGCSIEPGETSIYQRGRFDGDFFSRHLHPACKDIWFETADDEYLGDFREGLYYWLEGHLGEAGAKLCMNAARDYSMASHPRGKRCLRCDRWFMGDESNLWCNRGCALLAAKASS